MTLGGVCDLASRRGWIVTLKVCEKVAISAVISWLNIERGRVEGAK